MDELKEGREEYRKSVLSELKGLNEIVGGIDKKLDLHIQSTAYEFKAIGRLDEQQNKLIDQHIEGVKTLKSLIDRNEEHNQTRFLAIEEPKKVRSALASWLISLGSVAAAVAAALAVLPYLKAFLQGLISQ